MREPIAVVEDDPQTCQLLEELLRARGYPVETFAGVEPAREALDARAPALVIVDVGLPDGSGLELVSRLRDRHGPGRFPVLVVSGRSTESDILRGYAAGADDYLTKPFKPDELLAKVAVLLARRTQVVEAPAPLPDMELPSTAGLVFGRYQKLRVLGRGSYGTVYEARDTQGHRAVALKVLSASQGQLAENRLRFLRETYALSGLHHPHVVRVLDFGLAEGRLYLAMELVPGPTLHDEARGQRLDEAELLETLIPLADALEALRRNDLIHRDLKPSNVVLRGGRLDQPVLIDFGLSKHGFDRGLTDPDVLLGTPGYIAPEACFGAVYDHRADLWALGMVARYCLCGGELWPMLEAAALFQRLDAEEVPLPEELSPGLERVLRRLLARDPAARYQQARELLRDLRALGRRPGAAPGAAEAS
ncbi:MAG: protein kinase [Planctomycetota bacterium]